MRIGIVTLGCDKNTVDNEYLAGMLEGAGLEVVGPDDDGPLDAAVVTTCGFIASARQQSIDTIGELARRKRESGSPRLLFVAGCLAQRAGQELMDATPEIDGLVGVGQFKRLTEMILARDVAGANGIAGAAAEPGERLMEIAPSPTVEIYQHLRRKPLENKSHAFLKLSDGCNHTCSFCAIPLMKGKLKSVAPDILLAEARELLARGVREICLVSQDLSEYGRDMGKGYGLPELLRDICRLEGDFWVRCLYYYPGNINDRFLEVLASEPKIARYLEMPLQHLHPGLLRRMKRPFHEKNTFELIDRIRAAVPGVAIRSTMIVGFPGETQEEFQFLLDGVKRIGFDRLGVFEYSPEVGTPAGESPDQIPDKTKRQRWRMVMERQAKISEALQRERKGKTERVLVERFDKTTGHWMGRSYCDAPEVDGAVLLPGDAALAPGQFIDAKIKRTTTYDVFADPVAVAVAAF